MKSRRLWPWLLLLVPMALGIARLRFDVEILNLLPEQLSVAQGLKVYQQHFSDARELIITVEASTPEETDFAAGLLAESLRLQTNLVAGVMWQPAWQENPAQATELVAFLWLNQAPAVFGQLTNRLAITNLATVLAEAREALATSLSPRELGVRGYDPFGLMQLPEGVAAAGPIAASGDELFVSPEGTFRILFVAARPDLTSYKACRAWLDAVQEVIADARDSGRLPAAVKLHFTGRPAFVTEIAGGMESDMTGSAGGTLLVIGVLFWLTHRRLRPLFWLLLVLVGILAGTTALGGLFFGAVNVVSMGFAAILLGLAEDFGIVIYQESRSHPELDASKLRRAVAPGIFWSAVTTAGAFLTLNLSALPGLGQLGSFVAIGVILGALVMLFVYLPPLLNMRRPRDAEAASGAAPEKFLLFAPQKLFPPSVLWGVTVLLVGGSAALLWGRGPEFDRSPNPLKPKNSQANAALDRIKAQFGRIQEPLWVLVPGASEGEVAGRLVGAGAALSNAVSRRLIEGFTLPTALWPQPEYHEANRSAAAVLLQERPVIRAAALRGGFSTNSLAATEAIFDFWQRAVANTNLLWPSNQASRWVLGKIAARTSDGWLAVVLIHPTTNAAGTKQFAAEWPDELRRQGVILSGWGLLGTTVFEEVIREFPRVVIPIVVLVVISLWLAFRSAREVLLSLSTLACTGLCLWGVMGLLRWDWNILNLMALPLLLGMGVDFSIHIQLALRRHRGDRLAVRRSVGRALLLAGATTIAGFGSLSFSTNAGMASLGRVCALGIALALAIAVYLLPVWWKACMGRQTD